VTALTAEETHAHTFADSPTLLDPAADCVDHTDHLVTGNDRLLWIRPLPLDGECVAMTYPARQRAYAHLLFGGVSYLALHQFEFASTSDLVRTV
jgi:hypothetical protein